MNPRGASVGLGFFAAMACGSGTARAQATGQDVATAQALFDEGKRLMEAKDFAAACPKLVESQRLDPGGGTLFAIALCHEAEGKTATAWADYTTALAEARKTGRKDREEAAAKKEAELESKLTRMRIVVSASAPGFALTRDGVAVGEAQWGVALPIDPGAHTFAAKAPGKIDWTSTVDLRGEGATIDVVVPALADAPPPPPPARVEVERPRPAPEGLNAQKVWAVVVGAAGVVGVGVGAGLGISAFSKWSTAEEQCPDRRCPSQEARRQGDEAAKSAGTAADLSTVLVGVGAGALVAGVVLWITAPRSDHRALYLAPARSGVGLSLGGAL
ncbi:MAG: hypothetical protein KIT84_17955 [Labilithrix sp.]|nr:hypothetical protein [Labilithrix sp.]MCW5812917.1 hypothetical protein [Labilithrix sp.]